jgi:uncharacterized protein (TIGR02271 family)
MSFVEDIREGMQVYGTDEQPIGTVEKRERNGIVVNGRRIPADAIDQVVKNRVYVRVGDTATRGRAAAAETAGERELHVPIYEERLDVEKRQGELGEVRVHKDVIEEQVSIPVELRREQVHVEERDIEDRPVDPGQMADAFKEGTIRVPVRGEEAIVEKQAYVTGEVVIDKEQVVERQEIRDTVRRERVHVEEDFQRARGDFERHFQSRHRAWGGQPAAFDEAEAHYRTGYEAALDDRYAGRTFEEIEPELREQWGKSTRGRADDWQHLRERIREGWNRARRA